MRPSLLLLLVLTLGTACTGRNRKPAIVVGGVLVLAGTAGTITAAHNDCDHGDGPDFDAICGTIRGTAVVTSILAAVAGTSLLVGSIVRDEPAAPSAPPPPLTLEPVAPASPEPPSPAPASPPPAMEPQPAAW